MNNEKPIHSGILLFLQEKIVLKKSWQQKFCLVYNSSMSGIERLEMYDSAETKKKVAPRIFILRDCIKIMPIDSSVFTIITKSWSQTFAARNEAELNKWIQSLQSVAFKDNVSRTYSVMEDNDLYCSSADGAYSVQLFPTELSKKCNLVEKTYTLTMSATSLLLIDPDEPDKVLFTWPYPRIRRYGYKQGKLTFEAGSKCKSGEGVFQFEYPSKDIFTCLSHKMKSMKKLLNGEPIIDDSHFPILMEPFSRSPLPPSSSSQSSGSQILQNISEASTKSTLSSSSPHTFHLEFNSSRTGSNKASPTSVKDFDFFASTKSLFPNKKSPTSDSYDFSPQSPTTNFPEPFRNKKTVNPVDSDYEPIETLANKPHVVPSIPNYAKIVERKDAWRELGVSDVKHVENVEALDTLMSACKVVATKDPSPVTEAPKIIPVKLMDNDHSDNYNFLVHIGSVSKLNNLSNNASDGYQKIGDFAAKSRDTFLTEREHQSDVIGNHASRYERCSNMCSPGYGRIQRAGRDQSTEGIVPHHVVNDSTYAVISKPKRV